jgi:hypothetical protein
MKLILAISAFITTAFVLNAGSYTATAQSQKQTPPGQQREDVVRVNTNLVQTDVMVFDKQGHFVDGLQRDQFELLVDGKPQAISFFEQVRAGSAKEQSLKLNAATIPSEKPTTVNENRGRIIVFFLDDLHLSLDSLTRTRKMLAQFIPFRSRFAPSLHNVYLQCVSRPNIAAEHFASSSDSAGRPGS